MTTNNSAASLHVLGDRGQTVGGAATDLRGRHVKDKEGDGIGKVADLIVDDQENKVRFLLVEHGGFLGFGETKSLIPVDAITKITEDDVIVDQSRERVSAAPVYDPDLVDDRPYQSSIYNHYGHEPFWGSDYAYPSTNLSAYPFGVMNPEASPLGLRR